MQKGGGHLGEGGGEAYSRPDNRVQGPVRRRETVQASAGGLNGAGREEKHITYPHFVVDPNHE